MTEAGDTDVSAPSDALVDLWRVDLNPPPDIVQAYRRLLSPEECQRADRYLGAELTRRSIVCRGALRKILGAALGIDPASIRFHAGPHGKPELAAEHRSAWQFNVSHTADFAVVALAFGRALGVDVESPDRNVSWDELTSRFFSAQECREYFAQPPDRREAAFYRIWTCKEAYLKAIGAGLSFPLGKFSVSVAPDEPPGLLDVEDQPREIGRWSFVAPDVGNRYVAALAVEGHGWTLRGRDWDHCVATGISTDRA